ncbi:MAG: sugar ABC transporter permease [Proteobacteria bacterium]|nr:sugar ABC transporter permease [Pseudomonadota bacterium]
MRSNDRWTLVLLAPVFLLLTAIIFLPEIWAGWISFTNYRLGDPSRFIGFANFEYFLTDPRFWNALRVNVIFVIAVVTIQMVVGLAIALFLAQMKSPLRFLWIAMVLAPMAVSPAVSSVIWRYLFDANIGPLNYFLEQMGFERMQWLTGVTTAMISVIIVEVWLAIPHVVLFVYPARITFPQDLYEAAEVDGATAWQKFRYITFPLLRPAFLLALVFRVIITIRAFGVVWLLTKGGPGRSTELLAIYMFKEGFENWRFGSAAAIAWAMLIITILISSYMIYRMYQNAFVKQRKDA